MKKNSQFSSGVDVDILVAIAKKAGEAILEIYTKKEIDFVKKNDLSPVTQADILSHEIISLALSENYPNIPIISEEGDIPAYSERKNWKKLFIVDPLDGTREFIKKNGEFTVNIAYVENGEVLDGVIYAPVRDELYYSQMGNAFKEIDNKTIQLPLPQNKSQFNVVVSRSHRNNDTEDYIKELGVKFPRLREVTIGSSLKFCLIASGEAQLYPRLGSIMEWDIAAAHGIIKAAGGDIVDFHTGQPLTYNNERLSSPWFIASLEVLAPPYMSKK